MRTPIYKKKIIWPNLAYKGCATKFISQNITKLMQEYTTCSLFNVILLYALAIKQRSET